jgi:protein-disulfide isomerase
VGYIDYNCHDIEKAIGRQRRPIEQNTEIQMETESLPDDIIVIKKSWVTHAAVGVVFLVAGGLGGYFLGAFAYGRGEDAALGQIAQAPGAAAAPAQAPAQPQAPPSRIEDVNIDDDPMLGDPDAPIVIVEFSDFECPFCARFRQDTFDQIVDQYGDDILLVYRDFPLSSIHPRAQAAAEASECADDQDAFWDYHDLLFANQAQLDNDSLIGYADELQLDVDEFTTCLESGKHTEEVLADFDEGRSYGVTGTPTFFINGVRLVGAQPFISFEEIIEQELSG